MRILGLDPSSTYVGAALIDTPDSVRKVDHWARSKRRSHSQSFKDLHWWLSLRISSWHPQMAVIEMLSVDRNARTAKILAFYQAAAALSCKLNGLVVIEAQVRTARSIVLGNGGMSKDDVWEVMRKRYPDLFSAKNKGGLDECDALVLALAGETAAEK